MTDTISSIANSLQFLSNLGDVSVAQGVESVRVAVRCNGALLLDEMLYADEEGEVVLYDTAQLLRTSAVAGANKVEVTVGEGDEAVTTSFDVVYCSARIVTEAQSDNRRMLAANWLTSAMTRCVAPDQQLSLMRYKHNRTAVSVRCDAVVLHLGSIVVVEDVGTDAVEDAFGYRYDVSPQTVFGHTMEKMTELGFAHPELDRLVSYAFSLQAADVIAGGASAPSVCRFDVVESGASDVCVEFFNMWGFTDVVLLRGSASVDYDIEFGTAYIGGKLSRTDSRYERSHAFAVPLATDEDLAILEQIAGSNTIRVYDGVTKRWTECVVTGAEPNESTMGNAENGYVITYRPTSNNHRTTMLYSGSTLRQGAFDDRHSEQFG